MTFPVPTLEHQIKTAKAIRCRRALKHENLFLHKVPTTQEKALEEIKNGVDRIQRFENGTTYFHVEKRKFRYRYILEA